MGYRNGWTVSGGTFYRFRHFSGAVSCETCFAIERHPGRTRYIHTNTREVPWQVRHGASAATDGRGPGRKSFTYTSKRVGVTKYVHTLYLDMLLSRSTRPSDLASRNPLIPLSQKTLTKLPAINRARRIPLLGRCMHGPPFPRLNP